jgi:hypothetical protein
MGRNGRASLWREKCVIYPRTRDVNGAPKPDYPWGIPLLGLGYGLKQIPMGIDLE